MNDTIATAMPRDEAEEPLAGRRPRRRKSTAGRLRVLFVTPFSPVPADAGQRKRVRQMLQLLQDAGLSVSLLLYAFEGAWASRFQDKVAEQLREEYDEVMILPADPRVGARPAQGTLHSLDEWWDDLLAGYLSRLFRSRHFDVLLVNNVWLSKALTLAPPGMVRVIDMHDLFHLRERAYAEHGIVPEFFRISEKDELAGLNRADICISISVSEAAWLAARVDNVKVVYLPYADPAPPTPLSDHQEPAYRYRDRVVFGFMGTSHTFNVSGVSSLLEELCDLIGENFAPIELVFAGTICDAIGGFASRIHMTRLGHIEDEDEFYDLIDFYIVPVFHGTGFKVKIADITRRGKPTLLAQHAAEGLAIDQSLLVSDVTAMAAVMSRLAFARPRLAPYVRVARDAWHDLHRRVESGTTRLLQTMHGCHVDCIVDLRNQEGPYQVLAFLSIASMAVALPTGVRLRVLVDRIEAWLQSAAAHLPPWAGVEIGWQGEDGEGLAVHRVWWRLAAESDVPVKAALVITDLRFAQAVELDETAGELIVRPSQIWQAAPLGSWRCLPYLGAAIVLDPVARAVLQAISGEEEARWEAELGPDAVLILVDHDRLYRRPPRRLLDTAVLDVRDGSQVIRLIAALHRASGEKKICRILDGCTSDVPLRHLVLEMAILCHIPIATTAFGVPLSAQDSSLAELRTRLAEAHHGACDVLSREFEALHSGLRRRSASAEGDARGDSTASAITQ